jgi:ATP-binding cassette, subfamily B, bacterial PglK
VLIPFTRIASSSCVAIAILAVVFITDPSSAATAFLTLGSAYALIYWYTGSRVDKLGQLEHEYRQQAHRVGSEAFGGIKDLKLLKREALFIDSYRSISERITRVEMRRNAIGLIPRYAIETLAIAGVVLFILYLSQRGAALGQMLPMLTLYLLAGYRLLPAMQTIYTNLGYVRYARAALQVLHNDLDDRPEPAEYRAVGPALAFEQAIDIRDVSFAYPQAQAEALRGVSLRIDKNTSVAFVGTTGAGKTTLVDMLMGLLRPNAGSILIDGVALTADNIGAWQRNIGYVPQHIWLSDDSITRNIAFGVPDEDIDHEAVRAAATAASLHEFIVTELGQGYDTVIGERGIRLSGGQRQRVGIARALYHRPSVLVLDEATSALDGATEKAIIEAVNTLSRKITVILIAHRLNTVIDCDRIFVLERGSVVDDGNYAGLLRDSSAFQRLTR